VVRLDQDPAVSERFFNDPILNSPYERPSRHWELVKGIPTQVELAGRRESQLITPIPKPRKRGGGQAAEALAPPRVSGHPALLLPDRSGRDGDLADGGGTGEQKLLCWREEDE